MRTYGFLAAILPYTNAEWEKLSIFLNFLIPKLPAPKEEDLSKGLLETIDMDSYRAEKSGGDEDPAAGRGRRDRAGADERRRRRCRSPSSTGSRTSSRRSTRCSGTSSGRTPTGSGGSITEEIPAKVAADQAYQNAQANSDKQNARIEHDKALGRVMNCADQGRHRALQAVQRQRVVPEVADRDDLRADVRAAGGGRRLTDHGAAGATSKTQPQEVHPADLACAESLGGHRQDAIRHRGMAIERWDGARDLARKDSDFDAIRDEPSFQELVA